MVILNRVNVSSECLLQHYARHVFAQCFTPCVTGASVHHHLLTAIIYFPLSLSLPLSTEFHHWTGVCVCIPVSTVHFACQFVYYLKGSKLVKESATLNGRPLARRMALLLPAKRIRLLTRSLAASVLDFWVRFLLFVVITQKEDGNLAAVTVPTTADNEPCRRSRKLDGIPFQSFSPIFLFFLELNWIASHTRWGTFTDLHLLQILPVLLLHFAVLSL